MTVCDCTSLVRVGEAHGGRLQRCKTLGQEQRDTQAVRTRVTDSEGEPARVCRALFISSGRRWSLPDVRAAPAVKVYSERAQEEQNGERTLSSLLSWLGGRPIVRTQVGGIYVLARVRARARSKPLRRIHPSRACQRQQPY